MNESRNLKLDEWQMMLKLLCFKDVESQFLVFIFGFVLLFCRLLCLMLFFNGMALVS
jgi:hypothetical protein